MADFSFLAVPNVEGIRMLWYLRVLGILLVFGVSLFFVFYIMLSYRREKNSAKQKSRVAQHTHTLSQHMLTQKVFAARGKTKLVLFIEYVEKFVTIEVYMDVSSLLLAQGFTFEEAEELSKVLYADEKLSVFLEKKINSYLATP